MNGLLLPDAKQVVEAFTEADDFTYWGYTHNTVRDFMYELGVLDNKDFNCVDMIDVSFVEKLAE